MMQPSMALLIGTLYRKRHTSSTTGHILRVRNHSGINKALKWIIRALDSNPLPLDLTMKYADMLAANEDLEAAATILIRLVHPRTGRYCNSSKHGGNLHCRYIRESNSIQRKERSTGEIRQFHSSNRRNESGRACAGIGAGVTTASADAYSNYESELVPAAVVVGLIDINALRKQPNQKCQWSDYAVPKTSPNPAGRAFGSLYLEFEPATESAFAIASGNYKTTLLL
jgi:hypothetical protein